MVTGGIIPNAGDVDVRVRATARGSDLDRRHSAPQNGRVPGEAEGWKGRMPQVGQRAERSRRVEADYIRLFTQISGDRNPLHYDEAAAKASRFGEIVVQGGVTSSILNALVAEDLPGPGTVFLQVDWRFTAPVRPGDTITGAVEVLEVRADKPITKLATSVRRQDGVVALEGTAVCYTMDVGGSQGPQRSAG
jgi:acyl dehydratase